MISITEIKEKFKEQLSIDLLDLLKKYDPSAQNKSSQFKYTKWLVSCTDEIATGWGVGVTALLIGDLSFQY